MVSNPRAINRSGLFAFSTNNFRKMNFNTGYLSDSQSVPPKKPGRPSKKSGAVGMVEVGAVKNQNSLMCSHESGHTGVIL